MAHFLIQHFIDICREKNSKKLALSFPGEQFTYEDLWTSSNKLANLLKHHNIQRQDRVAIYLKRSAKSVIAMLGILKSDAIYITIDSKTPLKRLQLIMNDCEPAAVICDRSTIDSVLELTSKLRHEPTIIFFENRKEVEAELADGIICKDQIDRHSVNQPDYQNIDTDIAQIIYTSGSTGTPKGVMISHLNITNYIKWAVEEFQISEKDVILGTAPFQFDMSTFDIYCALISGSTLCIAPDSYLLFPKKLINLIDQEKVTIWKGISSLLMYLARTHSLDNNNLATLKTIIFAGEVLPTKYLIDWMKRYPEKEFYNGYGPSEGTGMSTFYKVEKVPADSRENIPIGKTCANCEVILLKESNIQAEIAEIGEICIRGSGVSRGYWNDPHKTNSVFIPNPQNSRVSDLIYRTGDLGLIRQDGNIEFVGRKDQQVKWMGYRIELGEIESTLTSFQEINDAVVLLFENGGSDTEKELIACVELTQNSDLSKTMEKLTSQLPQYMIPKRIVPVHQIPRSNRGKVDREKLLKDLSN